MNAMTTVLHAHLKFSTIFTNIRLTDTVTFIMPSGVTMSHSSRYRGCMKMVGPSKLQGLNYPEIAGHEIAGHEIAGHENDGPNTTEQ